MCGMDATRPSLPRYLLAALAIWAPLAAVWGVVQWLFTLLITPELSGNFTGAALTGLGASTATFLAVFGFFYTVDAWARIKRHVAAASPVSTISSPGRVSSPGQVSHANV